MAQHPGAKSQPGGRGRWSTVVQSINQSINQTQKERLAGGCGQPGCARFMQFNNEAVLVRARDQQTGEWLCKASSQHHKEGTNPTQERPTQAPVQNTETLIKTTMSGGWGAAPAPGAADGGAAGEELSPESPRSPLGAGGRQAAKCHTTEIHPARCKTRMSCSKSTKPQQDRSTDSGKQELPVSLFTPPRWVPTLQSGRRGRKHLPTLFWCCVSFWVSLPVRRVWTLTFPPILLRGSPVSIGLLGEMYPQPLGGFGKPQALAQPSPAGCHAASYSVVTLARSHTARRGDAEGEA